MKILDLPLQNQMYIQTDWYVQKQGPALTRIANMIKRTEDFWHGLRTVGNSNQISEDTIATAIVNKNSCPYEKACSMLVLIFKAKDGFHPFSWLPIRNYVHHVMLSLPVGLNFWQMWIHIISISCQKLSTCIIIRKF